MLFSRETKLKALNCKFNVPSTGTPPLEQEAAQWILLAVSEDIGGRKGTGALITVLCNQGHAIPRYGYHLLNFDTYIRIFSFWTHYQRDSLHPCL